MPRKSRTENVRKLCPCAKWKTCAHPWYLDYQRDNVRYRDNLDKLIGRHAVSFTEAKDEARRAIVAKLNGRDPKGILPADDPTLAELLAEYDREKPRGDRWQVGKIEATELPGPNGGHARPLGDLARERDHGGDAEAVSPASAAHRGQPRSGAPACGLQLGGAWRAAAALAVPRRGCPSDSSGTRTTTVATSTAWGG